MPHRPLSPPAASGAIHPRLGIIGGGQLARMTALAGLELGCDVVVLERNSYSPAANLASHAIIGDWDDPEALVRLASEVDVVTLENEFVNADSLAKLGALQSRLFPGAGTLRLIQDKLVQKQTLMAHGLPVPRFCAVKDQAEIAAAGDALGWPVVLKARRNGYDGKGNATVASRGHIDDAWRQLGGRPGGLLVEEHCPFTAELAVIVTRSRTGASVVYPLVETVQREHICHVVRAPAAVSPAVAAEAIAIAEKAVAAVDGVGSMGVEMFLLADGQVWLNELAPRVHNSGHYTIEACACSQFENHVRAVLGWPLGSTAMVAPAAVMVNLLGVGPGTGQARGIESALAVPGAHVHVYGKAMAAKGRKMGHVTALGDDLATAAATALAAAAQLSFGVSS